MRVGSLVLVATVACGGAPARLDKPGDDTDDGAGLLARASTRLMTADTRTPPGGLDESARAGVASDDNSYGGDPYGGDPYGGSTYASWTIPQWTYAAPNRLPRYIVTPGLAGAIEGTVSWAGAVPGKVTSACGAIDNPTLRVGADRAVRGAVVYIDKPSVGRPTPYYGRPASVGGVLAKHGCTLVPAVQIVAPLPAAVVIHGDDQPTRVRAGSKVLDLEEGGLARVEIAAGVTKIDGADGRLGAAWVIGLETPYYAITDDGGRFRIDELGPGSYELTVWQPPIAGAGPDGIWTYGAPIVVRRSIAVGATKSTKLAITLPGR